MGGRWVHLRLCMHLRPRGVLRQLAQPARHRPLRRDRASPGAVLRAGGGRGGGAMSTSSPSTSKASPASNTPEPTGRGGVPAGSDRLVDRPTSSLGSAPAMAATPTHRRSTGPSAVVAGHGGRTGRRPLRAVGLLGRRQPPPRRWCTTRRWPRRVRWATWCAPTPSPRWSWPPTPPKPTSRSRSRGPRTWATSPSPPRRTADGPTW